MTKEANTHTPIKMLAAIASTALTLVLLGSTLMGTPLSSVPVQENARMGMADKFDRFVTNEVSDALNGIVTIPKEYWLNDTDRIAPEPNQENFGESADPKSLQWLFDDASKLLDGQKTLFTTETVLKPETTAKYYLDETIFAVTWKQIVEGGVYTFSEVKIAHPSQFRRFLSEGVYGSGVQRTTTEMSQSVNAVVASSGDYYDYREFGIVVNEGMVYRAKGELLDTCYIDDRGDLVFSYAGQLTDQETVERFVEENSVRFSLSFGPVMIEEEQVVVPPFYNSGEINKDYARAALCQLGPLHYVLVTANMEDPCYNVPTVKQFAENLHAMGIPRAYALDGGQTAAIAMDSQLINTVSYGCQREISDIIYFATALPE